MSAEGGGGATAAEQTVVAVRSRQSEGPRRFIAPENPSAVFWKNNGLSELVRVFLPADHKPIINALRGGGDFSSQAAILTATKVLEQVTNSTPRTQDLDDIGLSLNQVVAELNAKEDPIQRMRDRGLRPSGPKEPSPSAQFVDRQTLTIPTPSPEALSLAASLPEFPDGGLREGLAAMVVSFRGGDMPNEIGHENISNPDKQLLTNVIPELAGRLDTPANSPEGQALHHLAAKFAQVERAINRDADGTPQGTSNVDILIEELQIKAALQRLISPQANADYAIGVLKNELLGWEMIRDNPGKFPNVQGWEGQAEIRAAILGKLIAKLEKSA